MDPIQINVENLVFTCKANCNLTLIMVSLLSKGEVGFNPKKFAAATLKFNDPKRALLMFKNGKMVCTGAKFPYQAEEAIEHAKELLRRIGYLNLEVSAFTNHNIVCKALVGSSIDCQLLAAERSHECTFEPNQFPGVVMRHDPIRPVTVLIFGSGKLVLTGAKDEKEAREKFDLIFEIVKKYVGKNRHMQTQIFKPALPSIYPEPPNIISEPILAEPVKKRKVEAPEPVEKKKKNGLTERRYIPADSSSSNTSRPFLDCQLCGTPCSRRGGKKMTCCLCVNTFEDVHVKLCSTCKIIFDFKK